MFPSPSEFNDYLKKLENVDLEDKSAEKEVYETFQKLNTLPVISYPLPDDFPITRARINKDGDRFSHKTQVWHKPDKLNTGFGRASNPHQNVFYGAIDLYPSNESTKIPVERHTALCEISDIYFTQPKEVKTEVATFSRWLPGKKLNMVCPFDYSKLSSKSPILEDMNNAFKNLIKENPEYEEQILQFNKFLSNQFSKYPIKYEYEYKLTALFTEMIINMGFDGVIYPSVKTDLRGFNVAIKSEVVERYFHLFAVCEGKHYHKKDYSIVNNDLLTDEINTDGSFKLSPDHSYKKTKEEILRNIAQNTS